MTLAHVVEYDFRTGIARIAARGDLDVLGASQLRAVTLKTLAEHPLAVLIDLGEVRVQDDLALLVLPTLARRVDAAPILVCASFRTETGRVIRSLLGGRLDVFENEKSALDALDQGGRMIKRHHLYLPASDTSPARARELVGRACEEWGLPQLRGRAELITSELVTNAVVHACTDLELTIALGPTYLHLHVRDRHRGLPVMAPRNAYRPEHSRGLKLIDSMATAWGTVLRPYGKSVWATLRLSPLESVTV